MKKALFFEQLDRNRVKCQLCNHFCIINNGNTGICGVRKNIDGILYSLNYGKIIAENIDPIEKKPLYHFLPKTKTYSIAAIGCNFKCKNCQNADISQASNLKNDDTVPGIETSPQDIIKRALDNNCQSIAYTYTEPTIFYEFALETMKLAKKANLKNIWVSNGYFSQEVIQQASKYLDAINIDLKFFKEKSYQEICGAKLEPVLENLKIIKKLNIWLEVTTLIIPTINDSDKELKQIAEFIKKELREDVPWHVSAFYHTYKMLDILPTPKETILRAVDIGKKVGLKNVYPGNI